MCHFLGCRKCVGFLRRLALSGDLALEGQTETLILNFDLIISITQRSMYFLVNFDGYSYRLFKRISGICASPFSKTLALFKILKKK